MVNFWTPAPNEFSKLIFNATQTLIFFPEEPLEDKKKERDGTRTPVKGQFH